MSRKGKKDWDLDMLLSVVGFGFELTRVSVDALRRRGGKIDHLRRLLKEPELVNKVFDLIVPAGSMDTEPLGEPPKTEEQPEYFLPLLDTAIPEQHRATCAIYRRIATGYGVPSDTPVCYRVKKGFTLKSHAPKAGPCYENFEYLQNWDFPDDPTPDSLAFWVPCILAESTSKTKDQQMQLLSNLRAESALPTHHLKDFGKVGLVAGLILAHHKATGERIPLNRYWVRTNTCFAGGVRLPLGFFDDAGLLCFAWCFDDDAHVGVGVFALGVEELGN